MNVKKDRKKIHNNIVDTNLKKYNVINITQTQEWKEYMKKRNLKEYGVEWYCETEEYKKKSRKTKFEKNGNETFTNPEQIKKTKIKRYGSLSYNNREKSEETCIKRYGESCVFKVKKIKDKAKQSKLERYGDENYRNDKKKEETSMKRYGVPHFTNSEKCKQTTKERYGTYCYFLSDDFMKLRSKQSKEWYKKSEKAKRLNGTLYKKISKEEQFIKDKLIQIFPNLLHQYKSDLYPFNCDFYIPEIDTYIEYQGSWTHGSEPYIGSDEQLKIVENWKLKNTYYYDKAIINWTERDVLKRTIAKKNGLNFFEFFTLKEFEEWFKNNIDKWK